MNKITLYAQREADFKAVQVILWMLNDPEVTEAWEQSQIREIVIARGVSMPLILVYFNSGTVNSYSMPVLQDYELLTSRTTAQNEIHGKE